MGSSETNGGAVFLTPGDATFSQYDKFYGFLHSGGSMIGGSYDSFTGLLVCNNFSNFGPLSSITLNSGLLNYNGIPGNQPSAVRGRRALPAGAKLIRQGVKLK